MIEISDSCKTCLIVIKVLKEKINKTVYSIDVAKELGITRQSICRTIKLLYSKGLIYLNSDKAIEISKVGFIKINGIYFKYLFFNILLNNNENNEKINIEAIRLANIVSDKSFKIIQNKYQII